MLFRRQNDAATPVASQPSTSHAATTNRPALRATPPMEGQNVRPAPLTATPTPPVAQQRRMITTPAGSFSMPSTTNGTNTRDTGTRKLQVGRDITLQGEIGACDHLVIEGTVKATIKQLQQFDILETGQFSGSVTSENADLNGQFKGELTVTGRLLLRANAVVNGTIRYGSLQVEKGACLSGSIDMIQQAAAPVTGPSFSTPANDTDAETDNSEEQTDLLSA